MNASLREENYVNQADVFVQNDRQSFVDVLRQALCGLPQALREWHQYLHGFLADTGCVPCVADPTLYVLINYGSFVFFVVYVDDVLLFAEQGIVFQSVIVQFKRHFEIRMFQRIDKFLVFSVGDDGTFIKVHNKPMVERLLTHFNMPD